MNKQNIEIRSFNINNDVDSRHISGYSVVFNSMSVDLGGFREIIMPTAITQELIDRSDVVMNYNHDDSLILARSNKGEGTLSLSLDEQGLRFDFDMPDTALGNQVLESIKRGDISTCSFAFSLDDESCETWTRDADNNIIRTINTISGLFDCAVVVHAAYDETSVSARSLDKLNELNDMKEQDIELREEEVKDPEEEQEREVVAEEEQVKDEEEKSCEDEEERAEEDDESETAEEEDEDSEEDPEEEKEDDKDPEEERNKQNTQKINTMEKRFSLVKAIRDIANHTKLDATEQAVIDAGAAAMRKVGQDVMGNIQIPIVEMRADEPVHYTVEADGEHVVVTDYLNILEPLRAENRLIQAGATFMTGLKGNVQLPIGTDVNVYFEGEITEAQNGAGSFSHVTLAPRRVAAVVPLSLQLLAQDTLDVEGYVRNLLVSKVNEKLESVILSEDAAEGEKPAGIFYNVTPTEVADFADICNLESDLEDANFNGDKKYIVSPKAKAALRSMIKGTNATGMVMENGEIDGTPAYETTHIAHHKFAFGSWSDLYIAQWGALDLKVDDTTWIDRGLIRLVVNAFFDYKVVRDGAIVYGEIAESDSSEG